MGRPSKGWRLRHRPGRPYSVSWTLDGERTELGLGTHDRREAERAAREAYSLAVQGVVRRKRVLGRASQGATPTAEVGREWLADCHGTLSPRTRDLYEVHLSTLAAAFPSLLDVQQESVEAYQRARLTKVLAATVRKELATLRGLLRWAHHQGKIGIVPEVRTIPQQRGTRYVKRRRVAADELSPDEVEELVARLPEWSQSRKRDAVRYPVRARFVVAYQTGLRPSLLDVLSIPENYRKGQAYLRVPDEQDKNALGRPVPLTPEAQEALASVAPRHGIIFGAHDYRVQIRKAALAALEGDKADRFTGTHLRSARITHLLERTSNVLGVQRLVGHTQLATTNLYARASDRAAQDVIDAVSFADKKRGQGR